MLKQSLVNGSFAKKALAAIVLTLGLSAFAFACLGCTSTQQASSSSADSSSSQQEAADDSATDADFELLTDGEAMTVFAANSSAFELTGEENACYSPASYYIALAMVAAGADGEAQDQLFTALGASSTEELDEYCQTQLMGLASSDEYSTIDISNSLWSNVGYMFQAEYQEAVEKFFDAGAFDVEFGTQQTNDMIKEWISDETRGLLEPDIKTDEAMVAMLINTIYFNDTWQEAFVEGATDSEIFHAPSGDVEAEFMHNTTDFGTYIEGEGYTAAQMPFSNGSTCTFFLPDPESSVSEMLSSPQKISDMLLAEPNSTAQISWSVPKFETSSKFEDLIKCANKLGVTEIFNPSSGYMFRNMIVAETSADIEFYISDALQETTIKLDEYGVEAAAYTSFSIRATSLLPEMEEIVDFVLDRPFAYAITAPNGVPLFMGVVVNPAA